MQKKVDAWRLRANELRSQAERTTDPVQRETLLRLANGWQDMAISRELILSLGGHISDAGDGS
jgi:hypothetical protein